jgi:Protein of unknown function (DUF3662)/Inner membrane component of T3SS, cytoplasmic domain/Caspase domain
VDRDLSRSRAILIGNSVFRPGSGIAALPPAMRCVDAMSQLLTSDLCGWPDDRITQLVNVASPPDLARSLVTAVRGVEDTLLVYYVGHGLSNAQGKLTLALADTDSQYQMLPHTGMPYETVASILSDSPARTKLVILDCCHAELATVHNYVFQSGDADLAEIYPVDGLYFIGASKKFEKAVSPLGGALTYFTETFIDVVRTGIPNQAPMLRLDQIFVELRKLLLIRQLPEPVESGAKGARQFPFARNAAPPTTYVDYEAEYARLLDQEARARVREAALKADIAEQSRLVDQLRSKAEHDQTLSQTQIRTLRGEMLAAQEKLAATHAAHTDARSQHDDVLDEVERVSTDRSPLRRRFERRLASLFEGSQKTTAGGVSDPAEILDAMTREATQHQTSLPGGRTLVPNRYIVDLATYDHSQLAEYGRAIVEELAQSLAAFIGDQKWTVYGSVIVEIRRTDSLKSGFRVTGDTYTGGDVAPAPSFRPAQPPTGHVYMAAPGASSGQVYKAATRPASGELYGTPRRTAMASSNESRLTEAPSDFDDYLPPAGGTFDRDPRIVTGDGRTYPLAAGSTVIGSSEHANLRLADIGIRGRHARFDFNGAQVVLTDLGSAEGTVVNGHRISSVVLNGGDEILLGATTLTFRYA